MSDDKDDIDASDWLAGQFNPTEQVQKQDPAPPSQPAQQPPQQSPTQQVPRAAVTPPPAAPVFPPSTSAPSAPAPSAPNSEGGFSWGLRPGGAENSPSSAPAASPPPAATTPVPPPLHPLVPPPPTAAAPTVPYQSADQPTRPLSWDEFAASQQAPAEPSPTPPQPQPWQPGYDGQPTEAYTVQPWQPVASPPSPTVIAPVAGEGQEPTSAIDSLFGEHQFQAYEEVGVLATVQSIPGGGDDPGEPKEPRAPLSTSQKVLMGVAGGLIGVLILIGMFFLGQHIGSAQAESAKGTSSGASTNLPTSAGTGGPAAPGTRQWSALQGGECIQPFSSAWATTFTVVACTADHDAEMVFKGRLPDSSDTGYPSTTQFQTELTALCSAPTAINYTAAAAVTDLQVSFSYPPSDSKWVSGDRTYYCFVDRQSGGNLPGDLSVQKPSN